MTDKPSPTPKKPSPRRSASGANHPTSPPSKPPTPVSLPETNDPNDPVLEYAWELYETYSEGSQRQKKSNSRIRQQIIWLIFFTSVLAVIATLPGVRGALNWAYVQIGGVPLSLEGLPAIEIITGVDGVPVVQEAAPENAPEALAPVGGSDDAEGSPGGGLAYGTGADGSVVIGTQSPTLGAERVRNVVRFLHSALLIVLSVATTSLLSYANQFTPMKAWIMYRVGADRIRSEIYLYRMLAGHYIDMQHNTQEIRNKFLSEIEAINREIYELETAPPFLQLSSQQEVNYAVSRPRQFLRRLRSPLSWGDNSQEQAARLNTPSAREIAAARPRKLPGRYYPDYDNGFNPIDGETYLQYRVIPQRDWYVKKVYEDYEKIKDWRTVILVIGGASAVFAAVQLEPYIVITTAAAVAINTHIQLNLIGSNYGNYHITASRIDAEIVRWRNMPEGDRYNRKNVSEFVANMEQVFEDERRVWMQQASQAQQETEQVLIKGISRRDGATTLAKTPDATIPRTTPRYDEAGNFVAFSSDEESEPNKPTRDASESRARQQRPNSPDNTQS